MALHGSIEHRLFFGCRISSALPTRASGSEHVHQLGPLVAAPYRFHQFDHRFTCQTGRRTTHAVQRERECVFTGQSPVLSPFVAVSVYHATWWNCPKFGAVRALDPCSCFLECGGCGIWRITVCFSSLYLTVGCPEQAIMLECLRHHTTRVLCQMVFGVVRAMFTLSVTLVNAYESAAAAASLRKL